MKRHRQPQAVRDPRFPYLLLPVVGAVFFLTAAGNLQARDTEPPEAPSPRIELLLRSGAYDLALDRIDTVQADSADIDEWLQWEKLRLELYARRGDWDELAGRVRNLPGEVPEIRRQALMTHAAELLLGSESGDMARAILRTLIWRSGGDSRQIEYWRRLVVRSYLADDLVDDARTAMRLYEREYLPADSDWDYLFAQVLLREGSAAAAAERLGSAQERPARVLRLLSRLRAGVDSPEQVIRKSGELRAGMSDSPRLAAVTWAITAEAAAEAADLETRVDALENLFNGREAGGDLALFDLDVGDLWQAYETLGAELGYAQNLLFGDPEPWMSLAQSLKGDGSALRARAINAAAARNSSPGADRAALHLALYERLQEAGLDALAIRLYEAEEVFPSVEAVPDSIRHRIVADSIERRDMRRAARFASHLASPSGGQTQVQWDLTRARLALFAGEFGQSESIMRSLILAQEEIDPETADRMLQPVFDLQSIGRGEVAYELLQYLHERVTSDRHKREILLWLGDARQSLSEYRAAAEYYLRSAYAAAGGRDQWGQSARYQAAEALAEAGLVEDARRIYEQLLDEAGEGKRAAALQRRLQDLWVKKQKQESSE
ncbi:MAG TPA: hypothetical protein VK973_00775 [Arenicellales bacterium]|nr:hypothetical protein [Arenicellales bacterium]